MRNYIIEEKVRDRPGTDPSVICHAGTGLTYVKLRLARKLLGLTDLTTLVVNSIGADDIISDAPPLFFTVFNIEVHVVDQPFMKGKALIIPRSAISEFDAGTRGMSEAMKTGVLIYYKE